MSSPCRRAERGAALAALVLLALQGVGCDREHREYAGKGPPTSPPPEAVRVGKLQPGVPIANTENPKPITGRGCDRSTILPTNGASTPVAIAIGAVSSADRVGDRPHTACA